MSICWKCHWGWPKQVSDIYRKYTELLDSEVGGVGAYTALNFGPAHIVWEDENWDKVLLIQWCIDHAQEYRGTLTDKDLELVIASLKELFALPDDVLDCEPENYDGEHPENFPPREGLIMVKNIYGSN